MRTVAIKETIALFMADLLQLRVRKDGKEHDLSGAMILELGKSTGMIVRICNLLRGLVEVCAALLVLCLVPAGGQVQRSPAQNMQPAGATGPTQQTTPRVGG